MPAKKTTKKAAPKKAAVKKSTKKSASKKSGKKKTGVLVCASGSDCFWVHKGPILKDLQELEKAFQEMSDDIFSHHVRGVHNDFADWVESVLNDDILAQALRRTKKVTTAAKAVQKRLKDYTV